MDASLCARLILVCNPSSHEPFWRSMSAKLAMKQSRKPWEIVAEDFDTLIKILVSIEVPEM